MFWFLFGKKKKTDSVKADNIREKYQKIEQDRGMESGIDYSVYSDKRLSPTLMAAARESMEEGASPVAVKFLVDGFLSGDITDSQFEAYCRNAMYVVDYERLREIYRVTEKPDGMERKSDYPNAFLGAAYGDIAGSFFEGSSADERDLSIPISDKRFKCTDDTVLSLATNDGIARAVREPSEYWEKRELKYTDFSENNTYPFNENPFSKSYRDAQKRHPDAGYGSGFLYWAANGEDKPYGSMGNGSAMRVSPIADLFEKQEDVIFFAALSAQATHNHPEGIKGAVVTAMAAWMARKGYSKDQILSYALSFYRPLKTARFIKYGRHIKDFTMDGIRWVSGPALCPFSVPAALVCFKEAENFDEVIQNVLSLSGDVDTIGAIAGTIAGAYYGIDNEKRKLVVKKIDNLDDDDSKAAKSDI